MPHPAKPDAAAVAAAPRDPNSHFLVSFDGTGIHYRFWRPATAARSAKPPVLIVHGAGEYGGRYREFAAFLNAAGYPVAAIDLRGFGQSGGPRAFVNRFEDYTEDIRAVSAQILRLTGADRFHLLGHSMGGLVAAVTAASGSPTAAVSLTLSSPCFGLSFPVPAHLRAIGAVCSRLRPQQLFATRAISELLTHDPEIARAHRQDPEIVHFMSARLFFEMHAQMARHRDLARRIQLPTAVFAAGDDRVVDIRATRAFFDSLGPCGKRWTLYPQGFHEIINETFRADVHRDILAFLDSI